MGIELTLIQMIPLLLLMATGISLWKKKYKLVLFLAIVVFISLVAMPFKMTQNNMSHFEDNTHKFDNVPEKVIVNEKSFEDYQNSQYNELKKESENEKF